MMGPRRSIPRRKDFWALKRNQCPLVALAGDFTGMRLQGLNYGVKQVVKKTTTTCVAINWHKWPGYGERTVAYTASNLL